MQGWGEFAAALVVFLLSHAIPVRPPVRPWLVARLGAPGYFAAYSLLSIAILAWLIIAAARAPYVEIIPPWPVFRWVPILIMPVASLLVVCGMSINNPLSFGGLGQKPLDPAQPGILALTRHPLLLALALWSGAHLVANGALAHVILFGLFAGFAVMGMSLIDRRKRMADPEWENMARKTAWFSLRGLRQVRPKLWQIAVAVAAFTLLLVAHPPVIGVSPLP